MQHAFSYSLFPRSLYPPCLIIPVNMYTTLLCPFLKGKEQEALSALISALAVIIALFPLLENHHLCFLKSDLISFLPDCPARTAFAECTIDHSIIKATGHFPVFIFHALTASSDS